MREFELHSLNLRSGTASVPIVRIMRYSEFNLRYPGREIHPGNPFVMDPITANQLQRRIWYDFSSDSPIAVATPYLNSYDSWSNYDCSVETMDSLTVVPILRVREKFSTSSVPRVSISGNQKLEINDEKPQLVNKHPLPKVDYDYYSSAESEMSSAEDGEESESQDSGEDLLKKGRTMRHYKEMAKFRTIIKTEKEPRLSYYADKPQMIVKPYLVQSVIVIASFLVIFSGYPQGFPGEVLNKMVVGPYMTVTSVLFSCACTGTVASLTLWSIVRLGKFGTRWLLVFWTSFLSAICHIYGGVFMIGAGVYLPHYLEDYMREEALQGFNSSVWKVSQETHLCCGITNYKSWDWTRYHISPGFRTYPQSCCDTSFFPCVDPPKSDNVYKKGCLEEEANVIRIICFAFYWLLSFGVFYAGFLCYYTVKMHTRYKWLRKHRDIFVSIAQNQLNGDKLFRKLAKLVNPGAPPIEILYIQETSDFKPHKNLNARHYNSPMGPISPDTQSLFDEDHAVATVERPTFCLTSVCKSPSQVV